MPRAGLQRCHRAPLYGTYMRKKNPVLQEYQQANAAHPLAKGPALLLARIRALIKIITTAYYESVFYAWYRRVVLAPLRALSEKFKRYSVYVLELEGGKYYVGSTGRTGRRKLQRWKEHTSPRGGSVWTRLHKPVRVLSERTNIPRDFYLGVESIVTAQLMRQHGVNNVRGAQFSSPELLTSLHLPSLTGFLGHHLGADYKETEAWLRGVLPPPPPQQQQQQQQRQRQPADGAAGSGSGSGSRAGAGAGAGMEASPRKPRLKLPASALPTAQLPPLSPFPPLFPPSSSPSSSSSSPPSSSSPQPRSFPRKPGDFGAAGAVAGAGTGTGTGAWAGVWAGDRAGMSGDGGGDWGVGVGVGASAGAGAGAGAGGDRAARGTCFRCGKPGHWAKACQETRDAKGKPLPL